MHVDNRPYSSSKRFTGGINQGSPSTVRMVGSGSRVFLENASCQNALCPQLISAEGEVWSGDVCPGLVRHPWFQFMVNSTPTPTALFWMTVYFLRCGISTGYTHVTSRMTMPAVMLLGPPCIDMVTMELIDRIGQLRAQT